MPRSSSKEDPAAQLAGAFGGSHARNEEVNRWPRLVPASEISLDCGRRVRWQPLGSDNLRTSGQSTAGSECVRARNQMARDLAPGAIGSGRLLRLRQGGRRHHPLMARTRSPHRPPQWQARFGPAAWRGFTSGRVER